MPLLTVAIPTFNRHQYLRATLEALRPQAHDDLALTVVDNCSEPPVEELVKEVLDGSCWSFRVLRNPVNVGLGANLLRCFEVAKGDWLWVLSDDDTVQPDAVATLLETIRLHPDLVHATFSIPTLTVHDDRICHSAEEFGPRIKTLEFIFMSSCCFHRRALLPSFSLAQNYIGTGAPHMALLLLHFLRNPNSECGFFSKVLVGWKPAALGHSYSKFFPISLCSLLDICVGSVRKHLAGMIRRSTPSISQLLIHLIRDAARGRPVMEVRLFWNLYLRGYRQLASSFWTYLAVPVWSFLFEVALLKPGLSLRFFEKICLLARGRPPNFDPNEVAFNSFRRLSET